MNDLKISLVKVNSNHFFDEIRKLQDKGLNLLFSNCILSIRIGLEMAIVTQFDTCLYNEDENVLLLIEKGNFNIEDVKESLNKENISFYHASYCRDNSYDEDHCVVKPTYFVEDISSLEQMLNMNQKGSSCIYYPEIDKGSIYIKYSDDDEVFLPLEDGQCRGLISYMDKFIFLLDSNEKKEELSCDIEEVITRNGMNVQIERESYPIEAMRRKGSRVYGKKFGNIKANYRVGC